MLAPAVPSDTGNGLAMRLGLFLEGLVQVGDVDLAVLPVAGPPDAPRKFVRSTGAREITLSTLPSVDTLFVLLSRLGDPALRLAAFRRYGRPSLAANITPAVAEEIAGRAGGCDLLHVARLYLADAVARVSGPALSLDLDEDDPESFRSTARAAPDPVGAAWDEAEADAFERLLATAAPRFQHLSIASEELAAGISQRHPALAPRAVPNAVRIATESARPRDPALIFVGSLQYGPNVDGLLWFANEVWPLVVRSRPDARLTIVGRNPPADLAGRQGIETPGYVADLAPLYRRAAAAIAPMRSGGGTRIKVLEAAAHGVPTVATPQSLAGIDLGPDAGWCARSAGDFAAACLAALDDPQGSVRRGQAAYKAVAARYDRVRVAATLADGFRALLQR